MVLALYKEQSGATLLYTIKHYTFPLNAYSVLQSIIETLSFSTCILPVFLFSVRIHIDIYELGESYSRLYWVRFVFKTVKVAQIVN